MRITAPRLPAQLLSPLLVATSGSMRQLVPRSVSRAPAVARKVNAWNRFAERARGLCVNPSQHRLSAFGTHHPMSHAAGNNVVIFDLVDSVAAVGEKAGQFAADYARNELTSHSPIPLVRGDNVLHLAPTALTPETPTTLYLRVTRPMRQAEVKVGRVLSRKQMGARPSEMIEIKISDDELKELAQYSEILVEVTGT